LATTRNQKFSGDLCGLLNTYDSRTIACSVMPLITTETRAVTLNRYVTQYQPDIGVAGTEILGGSRDLYSLSLTGRR